MIFKPELLMKILRGEKTQTRRPLKRDHYFLETSDRYGENIRYHHEAIVDYGRDMRHVYRVGDVRCLQIARARPAVWFRQEQGVIQFAELAHCHIWLPEYTDLPYAIGSQRSIDAGWRRAEMLITKLRIEDVRYITVEDSHAEGFDSEWRFLMAWCSFYDKPALRMHTEIRPYTVEQLAENLTWRERVVYFGDWSRALKKRPDDKYKAVVINFELVKE